MISSFTITAFKYFELLLFLKNLTQENFKGKKYFSLEVGLKGQVNEKIQNC